MSHSLFSLLHWILGKMLGEVMFRRKCGISINMVDCHFVLFAIVIDARHLKQTLALVHQTVYDGWYGTILVQWR